jgi:hypothetical protein
MFVTAMPIRGTMNRLRGTLTGSNVIALIALFVALGGTAGAAGVKLITGAGVKDGSITGRDLKRNSVTGSDIRDGSLHGADFSRATLATLLRAQGAAGAAGVTGATGAAGETGPQGPVGAPATLKSISSTAADITNYQDGDAIVTAEADAPGYYLAIASGTVTNTGSSDEYLNCGFDVAGTVAGAAGFSTIAGDPTSGSSVTVAPTSSPNQTVKFVCFDSGGGNTFDLANLKMKLVKLADQ